MGKFSDTVKQFTVDAGKNTDVVLRASVHELYKEVINPKLHGGNLPHDTGNLGRSVSVSKIAMPRVDTEEKKYSAGNNEGVINSVDAGDTIYIGFQANYAARQNFGFTGTDSLGRVYNQSGAHFIEKAEAKWPQIVKTQEARLAK